MFYEWLSTQYERTDVIGMIARAAIADSAFPRRTTRLALLLRHYDGQPALRAAMKDAHREWRQVRKQDA